MSQARLSACMLIPHKGHTDTIQVYSVTVMTHVKALQAGHSSQGTSEPITPATVPGIIKMFYNCGGERQTFACRLLTPIKTRWHCANLFQPIKGFHFLRLYRIK